MELVLRVVWGPVPVGETTEELEEEDELDVKVADDVDSVSVMIVVKVMVSTE